MKCVHCSTPVPDDATFCHRCGSAVSDAEGQAAATAAMKESLEQQLERMLREETRGEFIIERLLGKGGMALVYLAKEIHLDRMVAVKILPPELTFGHGVERFKREAKTAAALDHPHIIPIHRIAPGGRFFWYTMKYVEGRSLEDYLKEHIRLSLDETIRILEPVADALDYAHDNQVVHRDIKPANVMLDERNRVTVADFGIAKAFTETTLTASGSVVGTPYYMSPEQGMGKTVSGASDQYSVAVMAYRMLSGQVPFDGDSAIDILHKHCKEPPPPLEMLQPDLPPYVYAAIDKALSKSPNDRFSSVTAFVKGLKEMSPEISAEMDTVVMDADRSIQDDISTKVIGIRDEELEKQPKQQETKQAAPAVKEEISQPTGGRRKRTLLLVLIPLALVLIGTGVVGGLWLSGRPASTDQERLQAQAERESEVEQEGADQAAQQATPPTEPITGTVAVTGLPAAGSVTVNGERQTDTIFDLPPGTYSVGMYAPNRQDVEVELTIAAGSRIAVPYFSAAAEATTGTVTVTDLPQGGEIRVDGRRQSEPTFELERGRYTIRLTAPGYHAVERALNVAAGTGTTVQFTGLPFVVSLSISPPRPEVLVGDVVTVRAHPVDASGNAVDGRQVRWASGNASIATVTQDGVVRGVAEGSTTITATVEDQSAYAGVTVLPISVGAVVVLPKMSEVLEGERIQLNVLVEDTEGRELPDRTVMWESSDPSVATVTRRGVVTGLRAGRANISAHSGGRAGVSTLTVNAAPVEQQVRPQRQREINGPADLFARAAPDGWRLVESQPPEIVKYDSRMGTIRILRARQATPEAILEGLRTEIADRMSSLEEFAPTSWFETAAGEPVVWQVFDGIEGSGFNEARYRIILGAARNEFRGIGVVAVLEQFVDPDRGQADLRELLEALRR